MKYTLFFVVFLLTYAFGFGQVSSSEDRRDTSMIWQILTTDGNEYLGYILKKENDSLLFNAAVLGTISIPVKDILRISPLKYGTIVDGEVWMENRQATRYFWMPSGYGLRKGEGYYQNSWILFNQVTVGVSDNFSFGLGMVPLFLIAGAPTPVWITPKLSIPLSSDKVNLGVGTFVGTVLGIDEPLFGFANGQLTFGSRHNNFTLGIGYGFANGQWSNTPLITASGMRKVGKRAYLITENYFIDLGSESVFVSSFGGRVTWPSISLDYGGYFSFQETFVVIPWLGFSVPF